MGIVPIKKLTPGMILADDARDVNGRLILAKDKKIENATKILKFIKNDPDLPKP